MGKPAVRVAKGDERLAEDGRRHRVVGKTVGADGRVTIAYDVIRPGGGRELRMDVLAPDADTGFAAPAATAGPPEDYESA